MPGTSKYLLQYRPGIGVLPVVDCACPTGPTGTQGIPGTAVNTGATGPTGPVAGTDAYISAYSSTSQRITDGGTAPVDITHNTASISLNASISSGNIQVNVTGIYKILFSVQFLGISGNGRLTIFVRKNGTPVSNSSTSTSFKNGDEGVITVELLESLNTNDVISIAGLTSGGIVDIFYTAPTTVGGQSVPAGPGIITDVFKIA